MELLSQLYTGTALIGLLTYLGYQLRTFPNFIWIQIRKKIIYSVHIEQTSELFTYFENWLFNHHRDSFKNVKASLIEDDFVRGHDSDKIYEDKLEIQHYTDTFFIDYKGKKILIIKDRERLTNANDVRNSFYSSFKIEGWFAKSKITELLEEVIKYNVINKKNRQIIYTNCDYGEWMNFGEINGKDIKNIVLRNKEKIIDNIKDFISKKQWYLDRGLLYKRGYLFYGPPGNGKTSLCLAIAKHFNRNIYFLNLNDIEKDNNLFIAFNNIKNNSVLVIEDVDAIFGTREGKSKISFSGLLNCMDGAFSKYGIITIMTTNHIDKIDDALIREGRIDMKINIGNPDKEMVEEYLKTFYEKDIKLDFYDSKYSMSKIQEICLQHKEELDKTIEFLTTKI